MTRNLPPQIHHLGYVVDDLRTGVKRFADDLGAGPFFVMEHIVFDEVTYLGDTARYDHSSGFGQWGPILVELTQVHDAQPAGLREQFASPGSGVGHVAWLTDSLENETERLESLGILPFHAGRTGPASAVWFRAEAPLGHPIEVLKRTDEILRFYELVRSAAQGWDGSDPFRPMSGPPS
jgi:hypothetical protein